MKITSTGLEFVEFNEFKRFATEYGLLGSVALSEPVIDKSGNILIKEKVAIKENMLKKLESMEGKYIPAFKLAMSRDLMKMLKMVLSKAVMARIADRNNEFINHLYEQNTEKMASLKGIIQNAFYSKAIALAFFRILLNHKEFFSHLADFGLLALGSVIQKNYNFKMVNRYSFLAGLCADISTIQDGVYRQSLFGKSLSQTTSLSMEIARKFGLPEEVTTAINSHPIAQFEIPNAVPATVNVEELRKNQLNQDLLSGSGLEDDESINEEEEEGEFSDDTAETVLESLKIARYVIENLKTSSKDQVSEKLLVMFTYNTEKGMFRKDIADPMINRFTEFDQAIKRVRTVAEVENKCKFPPSAWAYPKPKAAQILCKDRNYQCPWIVNGWDLKIISAQDPFGYIGTALSVGTYPKCALEEELHARVKMTE
ncbi:hypothetical protein [Leptospira idonii]|uniref:Uncharacterized protein n=1 Tax=Leptospira idonii TaxID=1193500 RepID=A0A4R9LYJ6_9LEPT|nr:hypothetical protein [Leptospira idonii]TGN18427.1 hypothetical protein EHS15_13605 [Leptospira idonii]